MKYREKKKENILLVCTHKSYYVSQKIAYEGATDTRKNNWLLSRNQILTKSFTLIITKINFTLPEGGRVKSPLNLMPRIRGPFLESPGYVSDRKSNFQIEI